MYSTCIYAILLMQIKINLKKERNEQKELSFVKNRFLQSVNIFLPYRADVTSKV